MRIDREMQAFLQHCKPLLLLNSHGLWSPASRSHRITHVPFCSKDDSFSDNLSTQLSEKAESGRVLENYGFCLRDKPTPLGASNVAAVGGGNEAKHDETLAPFCPKEDSFSDNLSTQLSKKAENGRLSENYGFCLQDKPTLLGAGSVSAVGGGNGIVKAEPDAALPPFVKYHKPKVKVNVEYYDPKPGDFVVGVVVSGNGDKLDVNVGANMLSTMLTKEVLPLCPKEVDYLQIDLSEGSEDLMVKGRTGVIKNELAFNAGTGRGKPVVETGTILFAEVLGRTLTGRPLISTRRLFQRVAWQRLRQIKEVNEPIQVQITEWNSRGLLAWIEGLRAFLPTVELITKGNRFLELKEHVGHRIYVLINRLDEANYDLVLSERQAWEMMNLQEGSLLEGTVRRIFPYGAQIGIGGTNRSGLLHISNISRNRVPSVEDVLEVNDKVKVLVVKSKFPDKITLSIADLESEPGLFLSNREKVFASAEEMAKKYRQKLRSAATTSNTEASQSYAPSFYDDATTYANWNWFKFERDNDEAPYTARRPLLVSKPNQESFLEQKKGRHLVLSQPCLKEASLKKEAQNDTNICCVAREEKGLL